jgi:hypothetical protein
MKYTLFTSNLIFVSIVVPTLCKTYSRSDSIVGADFLTAFNFEAEADPTNGRV